MPCGRRRPARGIDTGRPPSARRKPAARRTWRWRSLRSGSTAVASAPPLVSLRWPLLNLLVWFTTPVLRRRLDGIARRKVIDGLTGFGKCSGHVPRAVDPQDHQRRRPDVVEPVWPARRNISCIVPGKRRFPAVHFHFPVAFEQCHLFAAVVAVHRRASPCRELRYPRRNPRFPPSPPPPPKRL